MSGTDLRLEFIQSLEDQIKLELNELEIPPDNIDREEKIFAGRKKGNLFSFSESEIKISDSEDSTFTSLLLNNVFRLREFKHAMGLLLLYSNASIADKIAEQTFLKLFIPHNALENTYISEYIEQFWSSYGDFYIKSCSLLDSIGLYLAFVFFGILDAPFYFNQVIEAINLKYVNKKRLVVKESLELENRESWTLLIKAKTRYGEIKHWRNEITHVFSPLMYRLSGTGNDFDQQRRQILRNPDLNFDKILKDAKKTYYLLRLVRLAADDISDLFIDTPSYHRNLYYY